MLFYDYPNFDALLLIPVTLQGRGYLQAVQWSHHRSHSPPLIRRDPIHGPDGGGFVQTNR